MKDGKAEAVEKMQLDSGEIAVGEERPGMRAKQLEVEVW
jgi:hypothetical protein